MAKRETDTRDTLRVVTHNNLITSKGFPMMSVKGRKLLYLTIAQCRKEDNQFYTYEIPVKTFANVMGVEETNIYAESMKICRELSQTSLEIIDPKKHEYTMMPLMALCEYKRGVIKIELNPRMTSILLKLKGSFTQPLLSDFMHMRSAYSMEIWHLMQREMKSNHPGTRRIDFYLSLDELREVTGTQDKLKQFVHFRERVWDKALREIYDNLAIKIEYDLCKDGRKVVGFNCHAYYTYNGEIIDLTDYVPDI